MKRCVFCSNLLEDNIIKCPHCAHDNPITDTTQNQAAFHNVNQQVGGFYSQTDFANPGFNTATAFQPTLSPAAESMSWKAYYKTKVNMSTKVAVILCAVFAFLSIGMDVITIIARIFTNGKIELPVHAIVAFVLELIAYVGGAVLLLVAKKWWAAAIIAVFAVLMMAYSLIVNHTFTSYLPTAFAMWATVSLILSERKYKNG